MSNVVRTDIDAVNAVLTVTLPKEEYLHKVQQDIKRYTQRSAMKGFRPGKTPPSLVKKMYGNAFLMEAVNDKIQEHINSFLETEKIKLLGQPLPSADQPKNDFDLKNPTDIVFKFDIGLMPEFDIIGLEGARMPIYTVEIDEKNVREEVEERRNRLGSEQEVEENIQKHDTVTLHVKELGGAIEKDLIIAVEWLTDDMKSVFLTQKKGDELQINIFQLERETSEKFVRKHFLGLDENDDRVVNEIFGAKIIKVTRRVPAEMNEEFFKKSFGGNVTNEEEAFANIRERLSNSYKSHAEALLLREFQDKFMADNQITLPEEFLKRWLKTQNEGNTDEVIAKGFKGFIENMRWTILRSKLLSNEGEIVSNEDLKEVYRKRISSYLGGMPLGDDVMDNLFNRISHDEKMMNELYEDAATEKVFKVFKSKVHLVEKPISQAEFDSIISNIRFETAKTRGEIVEKEPEQTPVEV
jgi:trigger factor